jgi:hypothetical protein
MDCENIVLEEIHKNGMNTFILAIKNLIPLDDTKIIKKIIENGADNVRPYIEGSNNASYRCMNLSEVQVPSVRQRILRYLDLISEKLRIYTKIDSDYVSDNFVELRKIDDATKLHMDNVVNFPEKDTIKKNIRIFSVIIALNDDYKGGEFYFPLQGVKLRLNAGDVLIFPPYWTHLHETGKLHGTFRYTITAWFCEK